MLASLLDRREKRRALMIFALMVLVAVAEAAGVVSIMPFIALLANPEVVQNNALLRTAYEAGSFNSVDEFLLIVGATVLVLLVASIALKALSQWAQLRFSNMRNHVIACRLVHRYLGQPYGWFLDKNSSGLSSSILNEVNQVVTGSLFPAIQVIAQGLVVIALICVLIATDPILATCTALGLGGTYAGIYFILRRLLVRTGNERRQANRKRFHVINEAFGGIKDIKFSGLESEYLKRFGAASSTMAEKRVVAGLAAQLPSYAMQIVLFGGMMLVLLYLMTVHDDFQSALPVMTVYGFAAYRLMPALQDVYKNFSEMRFSQAALQSLHREFAQLPSGAGTTEASDHKEAIAALGLKQKIEIRTLTYSYFGSSTPALKEIDLEIDANTTVAFVGPSGSGKTTMIDILLGLITADQGQIRIDGVKLDATSVRQWQRTMGYVPQHIFLADDTIAANIAFGVPPARIHMDKVEAAARIARLHDFVSSELPEGYATMAGERGVRLSGGQRQRIGIARALYHDPDVLVLDEATSALDTITERMVMEAVHGLSRKKTVIIVAHRLSTVRSCDRIFLLHKGKVLDSGAFDDLRSRNSIFQEMVAADEAGAT